MPPCDLSIQEALGGLREKRFSCQELIEACLKRIEAFDNQLGAFLTLNAQEALKEAQQVDKKIHQGQMLRPLEGIPLGLKDLFSTEGMRTTAGASIISSYIPPYEATAVKRLREAGAIVIGKLNEDAWGHGSSGENSDFFPTRNPYDLERVPGGSSSGSGAAVASGMCSVATGTDTGSSVRLPAAFCNLVGVKPTYGRVSRYGIIAMASSLDTIGHLTRTVFDNAWVLSVTAGQDPRDANTPAVPVPDYTVGLEEGIRGLRIGIPREYFTKGIDAGVKKTMDFALARFNALGADLVEVSLPHTEVAMACYYVVVPSEISSNLARFDGLRFGNQRKAFGAEAKRRIMLGTYTLSAGYYDAYYLKAQKVRTLIKRDFELAFEKVDVIVAPTSPAPPFRLGEKSADPLTMYLSDIFTCPINLAGIPALNVPAGFVAGLPIGLQIIGPAFCEQLLYRVGYAFESETQFYKTRPKLE